MPSILNQIPSKTINLKGISMADNKVFNRDSIEGFGGLNPKGQSSTKKGALNGYSLEGFGKLNTQKTTNPKK